MRRLHAAERPLPRFRALRDLARHRLPLVDNPVDQVEGALRASEQGQDRAALRPRQLGAEPQAAVTQCQDGSVLLVEVERRRQRALLIRNDGAHGDSHRIDRLVDDGTSDLGELLTLHPARDLVERLAQARGPVFLLDQAGQQIGL